MALPATRPFTCLSSSNMGAPLRDDENHSILMRAGEFPRYRVC
jgi:hypothetical protein